MCDRRAKRSDGLSVKRRIDFNRDDALGPIAHRLDHLAGVGAGFDERSQAVAALISDDGALFDDVRCR